MLLIIKLLNDFNWEIKVNDRLHKKEIKTILRLMQN